MTLEVACGACQGRLVVETPGVVVSCPHCGHHLTTPDFPVDTHSDDIPVETTGSVIEPEPPETNNSSSIFDESVAGLEDPRTAETQLDSVPELEELRTEEPDDAPTENSPTEDPPVSEPRATRQRDTVSRSAFLVLLSYASAVTLACLWLFYQLQNVPLHNLERLPDPIDQAEGGKPRLTLVAVDSPMPTGHTLALGQSRKFGHIRVTPLRVSRGSLGFEALQQLGGGMSRKPVGPVLKLHLQLENESSDQEIAPLDRTLMLSRRYDNNQVLANNFLRAGKDASITLLHDNPLEGNWNWKGQGADRVNGKVLEPGQSFQTYVPTGTEGIGDLAGPLFWRVHLRKGYSNSGRGVTTIFEVAFDSSEIQAEEKVD
ncbi:MAG: hypothetical protein VX669_14960 [Planctomycetota bacterium]|nr:hypothetical protein [Planctomycetota bacterium]